MIFCLYFLLFVFKILNFLLSIDFGYIFFGVLEYYPQYIIFNGIIGNTNAREEVGGGGVADMLILH